MKNKIASKVVAAAKVAAAKTLPLFNLTAGSLKNPERIPGVKATFAASGKPFTIIPEKPVMVVLLEIDQSAVTSAMGDVTTKGNVKNFATYGTSGWAGRGPRSAFVEFGDAPVPDALRQFGISFSLNQYPPKSK